MSTADSFWSRVQKADPSSCWEWTGGTNGRGYGRLRFRGRSESAHRVAFELRHGRRPALCILHSCDNPLCCNPAHLREGTHAENALDKVRRGRSPRGDKSATCVWPEEVREAVREAHFVHGMSLTDIAVMGIPYGTVSNILYSPKRRYVWNGGRTRASHMHPHGTDPVANMAVRAGAQPAKTHEK